MKSIAGYAGGLQLWCHPCGLGPVNVTLSDDGAAVNKISFP